MQRDGFQHIGQVIRQKYPESQPAGRQLPEPRPRMYPVLNDTAIRCATIIVLVAAPATLYFLVSEQLRCSFAALVTALAAAFGPKIYADFIQPRRPSPPTTAGD
jgi:hypothetical protein